MDSNLASTDPGTDFDSNQLSSLTWASTKGMQPGTSGVGTGYLAIYNDTAN